jgi:hypothetical protein
MAIYYVDPLDGDDSNSGLDFANRKKSVRNALTTGGNNTEVRVIKTPGGLLSANSKWTSIINTNPTYMSSATNLNTSNPPGGIQVTHNNHGFQTGDLLYFYAFSDSRLNYWWTITVVDANNYIIPCYVNLTPYNGSYRFVFRSQNQLVSFDTPKVKNLVNCATGLNSGNHVVPTWSTTANMQLNNYTPANINYDCPTQAWVSQFYWYSNFTTGKISYYTFPTTLDLSSYRQLSVFLWQDYGNFTTENNWKISLCSDSTGDVPVYDFLMPAMNQSSCWMPVTIDCDNLPEGQTMTTEINSIAIYAVTDVGQQRFRIQNIIACKGPKEEDCLSHTSVLSPKREGDLWYPVIFADEEFGAVIGATNHEIPGSNASNGSTRTFGYVADGFTSTHNTRQQDRLDEPNINCYVQNPQNTYAAARNYHALMGSSSSTDGEYWSYKTNCTVSGGWNRIDMSTRDNPDDISWFYSGGHNTSPIYVRSCEDSTFENLGCLMGVYGIYCAFFNYRNTFRNIHLAGSGTGIYAYGTTIGNIFDGIYATTFYNSIQSGSNDLGSSVWNLVSSGGQGAIRCLDASGLSCKNISSVNHSVQMVQFYRSHFSNFKNVTSRNDKYVWYGYYNAYYLTTQDVTAIGGEYYQFVYANNPNSVQYYGWRHKNINASGFPHDYGFIRPSTTGGYTNNAIGSWTSLWSTQAAAGFNHPTHTWGYADGTWVGVNGSVAVERATPKEGSYSMSIVCHTGGYRDNFGNAPLPAVSDQAAGIYSRGLGSKVTIAEVSVIANQTVEFSVQARRRSYDNNHIQGNLYVGPHCGNPVTRSDQFPAGSFNTWEEMSVSVTPTRTGVMIFAMEVFQYYGNSTSSPPRAIDVDVIICSQGA